MKKNTTVYKDRTYKRVETYMKSNRRKYENNVKKFISSRIEELNAPAPYSRISHSDKDREEFWKETGLKEQDFMNDIHDTYYGDMAIKPISAKEPFTIALMHIIKFYHDKKMKKELEMAMIHLSFSAKFYPYRHYDSFKYLPQAHILDYAVNNKMSYKFDLKSQGTVLKAIVSLDNTWVQTYSNLFKSWEDADVVYLIDQLNDRIGSFMKNIATVYYQCHKSGEYLAYSSDNMEEDDYRLADSSSLKVSRIVENTMNNLSTGNVNFELCKKSTAPSVNVNHVRNLIQIILNNNDNYDLIREMVTIITSEFFKDKPKGNVTSAEFIVYSTKPRPNTNNKNIIRLKEIQTIFLEQSDEYLKRMKRPGTQSSYVKALQTYITWSIYVANI